MGVASMRPSLSGWVEEGIPSWLLQGAYSVLQ